MQISPPDILSPFIKHYLFLESGANYVQKLRLFSDGNTGMVFCLNDSRISIDNSSNLPHSFLYGQISDFKDLYVINNATFIIVVFQPDGLYKLLGISANELKNNIISVHDVFGEKGALLHERLINISRLEFQIRTLNRFFYDQSIQHMHSNHHLLSTALNFISMGKGNVTIEELVRQTGYSERHIERIFSECIGVSPKQFGGIVKLHSFLKLLEVKSNETNITQLCYEAGYFDQSHLIRAFRKYTGITPTEYLNCPNRLAINFMEFNS
jgi:AraC-like DNA-binding protein